MIRTISPERREELLALLEDGPKACGELAGWLTISPTAVKKYLGVLERRGEVKRIGGATSATRWALASYLESVRAIDADVDDVEIPMPRTRQPKPSWWCIASRDGFTAAARVESLRMRRSKEARQVPWRVLT